MNYMAWTEGPDGVSWTNPAYNSPINWECKECWVQWRGTDPRCWICRKDVTDVR